MTFEEFKRLALNPPYNYEPSVYRVDVFRIQGRKLHVRKGKSFSMSRKWTTSCASIN